MSQMMTRCRWVAVIAVTLGLSVQATGGAEFPDQATHTHMKDVASIAIEPGFLEETLLSGDSPVVQISDDKTDKQAASSREGALYQPPQRGAPGGRVGGGTRGPMTDLPLLLALAPDHVGLASEVQPQLVWYLSKATNYPLEFTLIDELGVTPIIEKPLSSPIESGIHIIHLADYDLKLEKGKTYQWFVSLVSDPEHRSADIIGGGMIKVGEVPASLTEDLKNANPVEATKLWGQAGFWYDAIGVISTYIQSHPSDAEMHHVRASLLEEVDLDTPAQVDREHGL
ncbi:DUF928 domain-containing protein [Candidatus Nitrospira allomarina]|uniref:DUF928 domain-containing protein n=1 Tax=Candidatus Nitrospira allomarina TaxID=3020900 RepID=A0AA96GGQ4_9BACT|nr:DUF928 domain-containing protein [Candidatus Nitrospira allomarina]WNM58593.1 DUF928 domain-containing protein [Candidatus Nitrospira allomarina]